MTKVNFRKLTSLKTILVIIASGIWVLVLQNAGLIPKVQQNVYVEGGYINTDVRNTVNVSGSVDVRGSVDVGNRVDINISAINGYRNCFYNSYAKHPNDYYRLPVADY
jgi:hypothetical protein